MRAAAAQPILRAWNRGPIACAIWSTSSSKRSMRGLTGGVGRRAMLGPFHFSRLVRAASARRPRRSAAVCCGRAAWQLGRGASATDAGLSWLRRHRGVFAGIHASARRAAEPVRARRRATSGFAPPTASTSIRRTVVSRTAEDTTMDLFRSSRRTRTLTTARLLQQARRSPTSPSIATSSPG